MQPVSHQITIGSTVYRTGDRTRLTQLRTAAALDIPVNTARIRLSNPMDLSIAAGDTVQVDLGYGERRSRVFTGTVRTVEWGGDRVTLHAASEFQKLLAARFNLVYEQPKSGDIVEDVIGQVQLKSGQIDSGVEFSAYALGDLRCADDHLRGLAQQCGFDFYADPQDRVMFTPFRPTATHSFEYGVNILSLTTEEPMQLVTGVEVYGESPSSFGQGAEAYSWFTKQEVQGKAGTTTGLVRRLTDPTVRTLALAGQVATAVLETLPPKKCGTLKTLGKADVALGNAIQIAGMPVEAQNGTFKVTRVIHSLDARQGFCTMVHWEER